MALWLPGFAGRDTYIAKMVGAAEALLRAVGYGGADEPWLPLGVGLDCGTAYVGNVGEGHVKDFTALGDVVNTAARLSSAAAAGEILVARETASQAGIEAAPDDLLALELKGKGEPVEAVRIGQSSSS